MISRCSETRDRTMNRSEWSSEKTTDATKRGYRRTSVTSIEATRTPDLSQDLEAAMRVQDVMTEGVKTIARNSDC